MAVPPAKVISPPRPSVDLLVQDCRLLSNMLGKLEEYRLGSSSPSSPLMVEVMVQNAQIRLQAFEILYHERRDFQPDREKLDQLGAALGERYGFSYRKIGS